MGQRRVHLSEHFALVNVLEHVELARSHLVKIQHGGHEVETLNGRQSSSYRQEREAPRNPQRK